MKISTKFIGASVILVGSITLILGGSAFWRTQTEKRYVTQYSQSKRQIELAMHVRNNLFIEIDHGPINFIHSNIGHMDGYVQGLIEMLRLYQREYPEPSPAIVAKAKELQLDNIVGDAATVISSMHSDTERIKQAVLSLSQFSMLNKTQP